MNLFENLQRLNESENKLISEFKEFLASKNAQYIANEIGETEDGMQLVIYDGDWKHEHRYMQNLINEFFENKGIDIAIYSEEIGESESDTFSARYDIEFNVEPKTYTTDVKNLKFTTEGIEDSYDNNGIITELRTSIGPHNELRYEIYQDGTLMFHSTNEELAKEKFKEISMRVSKEYKMVDGKYKKFSDDGELASVWENVNTSNWKQRFKGMDIYVSDKYPEYQIKKSYTSSKQEVWSVLNFKTQREVFASGTFDGAVKWIENKSNLKESTESNSFQVGEEYEWSGLYGGSYTGIVKEIDEDSITLDVSWTAEDTGKLVTKELTYDLETDSEGNIAFIVWRYSGEKGYVYPKNMSVTESADISLDDYEYVGNGRGHDSKWQKYRRFDKELNKGVWVAKHQDTGEIKSITYDQAQGFEPIEDSGIARLSKDLGRMLLPKQETKSDYREPIKCLQNNKGDYINVYKDKESGKIRAEGDIVGSSFNGPWSDKDEEYYLNKGFKEVTESNDEDYDDNAATFLDTLEKEVKEAAHKFMLSVGFPEDEADDYLSVSTDINDDYVMVAVGAELGYDSLFNLCQTLDKVIAKHDEDAYFEPECPGRIVAYLFGEKVKKVHKKKEQALKDKIKSLDKVEETNHNIIEDRDYATGEEMYNEFVKYLNSLDQIAMDGNDCNWEPAEFNAKNLNADGEIYLECGAYILIYPYINEWAEDYFKVVVVDAETCELSIQLKNGIEKIFNKFKTDKWKLEFEG